MNAKKAVRIALDTLLTVMIVAEMLIQFTGVFLHEVIGFAFFGTVVLHLILSATWIKNTAKTAKTGKLNSRRKALAAMGILLAVNMLVLGLSSVAISTILASAGLTWELGPYAVWSAIHSVSSYTLCALVTVHLGMHWAFLASAFHVPYDPSRRRAISTGVNAVAAVGALALGALAVSKATPVASVAYEPNADSSSSTSAAAPSGDASAEAENATRGRKGKTKGSSSASSSAQSASSTSASSGTSGTSGSSSSSGSGSSTTQICTLCRKQCPFDALKCDKPYSAGLL